MNKAIGLLSFFVFAVFGTSSAQAMVDLSFVGAVNYAKPYLKLNNGQTFTGTTKAGLGGGVILDLKIPATRMDIETGLIYVHTKFNGTDVPWLEMPIALRVHLFPVVSVGLGAYLARQVGKVQGTYDFSKTDYGGLASLRFRIPLGVLTGFIVEGQYFYGIKDLNSDATGRTETRGTQGLAGLMFSF